MRERENPFGFSYLHVSRDLKLRKAEWGLLSLIPGYAVTFFPTKSLDRPKPYIQTSAEGRRLYDLDTIRDVLFQMIAAHDIYTTAACMQHASVVTAS
jgi:hypothetical protein